MRKPFCLGPGLILVASLLSIATIHSPAIYAADAWWINPTPWTYEPNDDSTLCGWSTVTAGDVNADGFSDLLVGSPGWDGPAGVDQGRVELFLGGPAGLGTSPAWVADNGLAATQFGYSVSPAGDVNGDGYDDVIIGAGPGHRAYAYYGGPGGPGGSPDWTKIQGSGQFGERVSAAGDVNGDGYDDVLIGEPAYDNVRGRTHLFLGSAAGLATAASWVGVGEREDSNYGFSLSPGFDINADGYADFLVGAPDWEPSDTNVSWGKAYVYQGGTAGPTLLAAYAGVADNERMAYTLAGLGAFYDDGYGDFALGIPGLGEQERYNGGGGGPVPAITWNGNYASMAPLGDVNGDGYADYVTGDTGGFMSPGAVNIWFGKNYQGGPGGPITLEADQVDTWFGFASGSAGDVNGDGFNDIVVGEPHRSNGQSLEGRIYVYFGMARHPLPDQVCWTGEAQTDAQSASIVACAGDVNGDGLSEYLYTAPGYDVSGNQDAGKTWMVYGGDALPTWSVTGATAFENYGSSAAGAGDVNGDGYDDVIIGARNFDDISMNRGKVDLYYGSATGLVGPVWTSTERRSNAQDGWAVSAAGDVNNDGYADFLSGARNYSLPATGSGRVTLYLGSSTLPSNTPAWDFKGETASDFLGHAVTGVGDINRDGFGDILLTASGYGSNLGRIYLFLGSATGPASSPDWILTGTAGGMSLGSSIDAAGDVNGDGYADFIVGSPGFRNTSVTGANHGRAQIFLGNASGTPTASGWEHVGSAADSYAGRGVGGAGDFNADGFSDVIVGVYGDDTNATNAGAAHLFLGHATGVSPTPIWSYYGSEAVEQAGAWVSTAGDVDGDGFADLLVGRSGATCGGLANAGAYTLLNGNYIYNPKTRPRMRTWDDSGPHARLNTVPGGLCLVGSDVYMANGRTLLRIEYQITDVATDLNTVPLQASSVWTLTGVPSGRASTVDLHASVGPLADGTNYHYRMRYVTPSPYFPQSPWFTNRPSVPSLKQIRGGGVTAGVEPGTAPKPATLRVTPNPFRSATLIRFRQERDGEVTLDVFDVNGRRVTASPPVWIPAGEASVGWDGRTRTGVPAPEGVYFLRVRTPVGEYHARALKMS